jgi:tetratricopeptide (TPR) repeat protein
MEQFNTGGKNYQIVAESIGQVGDRFIGQQRVAVIGLDPIMPELVAAKWIDRRLVQAELLGRIEAQAKLIELVAVGGFGKSLLATWLFHRVKDGFDRSLWLNFRKVPTFNEFARWVLQEIGFLIDDPRVTNEALITELVYRLTQKRCLLVLDQLEAVQESPDLESFGEFLRTWRQRGHKSVVVITTRSSNIVATEANYRLDLAGFTEAEGADFLRRQGIGAEEAGSMETLVQVAEGHPLLLGLAVSWLRQEAGGMIDRAGLDFFAGLFQKYRGDAEAKVEEIFSRLFEDLPERLRRLLLGVVVYRDAFGLEMARGMLADVEVEDLRSLVDEGFLLVRGDQWILHPLMGRLVGQALKDADRQQESHQRAIHYFLLNMKSSVSSIKDCAERLEIFHHWCELGQYALAYKIIDNCVRFLELQGCFRNLLPIYDQLTRSWNQPKTIEEQQNLGGVWMQLGILYCTLGEYQIAITAHQQAQTLFEQIKYNKGQSNSLGNLGVVYDKLGEYHKAINFLQQSLAIQRNIGDYNGEAASLCNLGNIYRLIGKCQKAICFYQKSLKIQQHIGDYNGEAASLMGLGNVYYFLGKHQRAIDFLNQSLAIYHHTGDYNGEASCLCNLGNVYRSLGKYWKSVDFLIFAFAIYRNIENHNGEASCFLGLGNTYGSLGEYQKAINFLNQSLNIQHNIGDLNGEASSFISLGSIYGLLGEHRKSINFYKKSLIIKHNIGDLYGEASSLSNLGVAYYSLKEYQKAINFLNQSLNIQHDIGDVYGKVRSLYNMSRIYQELRQFNLSRSCQYKAYRIWQELQLPLATLPFSDFHKKMFQYLGEDWIEQLIQNEQKLAWLYDSIGLISFVIRWLFSPIRWIQK